MKTWITSDWHLGETRFELMGRPFTDQVEHVNHLIYEHNQLVSPEDTLIVAGDVCYKEAPKFLKYVEEFNGKIKILVRGNHDEVFTDEQLSKYFDIIVPHGKGIMKMAGNINCYITHYPTEGTDEYFNLVGHIHGAWKYQLNMLNIGVDVHHFRPVDLESISFHATAIAKYYDDDVWVAYNSKNASYRPLRGKKGTYFRPHS